MKHLILLLVSLPVFAGTNEVYLYPQFVHLPQGHMVVQNGRVTADPYVPHMQQLFVRHMGKRAVDNKVTYDVGRYTGLDVGEDYQFGEFDRGGNVASSAAQLKGYGAGCMINTWQFDHKPVQGGGPNCAYQYLWDTALATAPKPFEGDGDLVVKMKHKLPQYYRTKLSLMAQSFFPNKGIGQSSIVVYFQAPDGGYMGIVVNIFDPRGKYKPFFGGDGYTAFASSPLETTRYVTNSGKHGHTNKPFRDEKQFEARITKQNLQNIIDDAGLNWLPEQYTLHSALWLLEVGGYHEDINASLGGSVRDFMVLNCSGECGDE